MFVGCVQHIKEEISFSAFCVKYNTITRNEYKMYVCFKKHIFQNRDDIEN